MYAGFRAVNHPNQQVARGALDAVDDRGTPPQLFEELSRKLGGFSIDVAASPTNARCARYYTQAEDGLALRWAGERVWCNPPFSNIEPWLNKAWTEWGTQDRPQLIAMLLPANRTDQPWWQRLVEPGHRARDAEFSVRFLPGRIRFLRPGQDQPGRRDRPLFGCCLLLWQPAEGDEDG